MEVGHTARDAPTLTTLTTLTEVVQPALLCAVADASLVFHLAICVLVILAPFMAPAWTLKYQLTFIPLVLIGGALAKGCMLTHFERHMRSCGGPACDSTPISRALGVLVQPLQPTVVDARQAVVATQASEQAPSSSARRRHSPDLIQTMFQAIGVERVTTRGVRVVLLLWWVITYIVFLRRTRGSSV